MLRDSLRMRRTNRALVLEVVVTLGATSSRVVAEGIIAAGDLRKAGTACDERLALVVAGGSAGAGGAAAHGSRSASVGGDLASAVVAAASAALDSLDSILVIRSNSAWYSVETHTLKGAGAISTYMGHLNGNLPVRSHVPRTSSLKSDHLKVLDVPGVPGVAVSLLIILGRAILWSKRRASWTSGRDRNPTM